MLLETRNDLSTLVHYLGALAGDHVVLPMSAGRDHSAVLRSYDPDVVIDGTGVHERRHGSAHRLHPDLALLLSTSGSTGSPKLVRLSRCNLVANATAIADYLDIRQTDRAATTLPMSYCYGLSVIHSHLLRGAGLILTDRSVVDDEFWTLFRRHRGTSFAGVPYTFEMLERIGFDAIDLPDLRYVTQAGGRLSPERVRQRRRARRTQGLATVRHVRRHGGDRPNGLPATGTRAVAPHVDRQADPRRLLQHRAARRMVGSRRRRAGVPRGQRDDGLRTQPRGPGAGQDRRHPAHR